MVAVAGEHDVHRVHRPGPSGDEPGGVVSVMNELTLHRDCGEIVLEEPGGQLLDLDGTEHLCVDYVVWHRPPDRRDPSTLDTTPGWRPAVPAQVRVRAA